MKAAPLALNKYSGTAAHPPMKAAGDKVVRCYHALKWHALLHAARVKKLTARYSCLRPMPNPGTRRVPVREDESNLAPTALLHYQPGATPQEY